MGFPAYFMTKEHKFCAFNSRDIQKYRLRRAETLLLLLLPIKIKCRFLRLEKKIPTAHYRAIGKITIGRVLQIRTADYRH